MLPVGTAPNAIVYGTGRITLRDMMRAGLPLDILAAGTVVAVTAIARRLPVPPPILQVAAGFLVALYSLLRPVSVT